MSHSVYAPPPYPPPPRSIPFPRISDIDRRNLAAQGWASVDLGDPSDQLFSSFRSLLNASKAFFDLPQSQKEKYTIPSAGSEAGWSRVEGEKELITLRSDTENAFPEVLREPAKECWPLCGQFLNDMIGRVALTLDLPEQALTVFSKPCIELKPSTTATMLRLFRYEAELDARVVAEPHNDLGLLSLVLGDMPGLQVWDRRLNVWYPIEESYITPTASVLVGQQLSRLTNQRYSPGMHRVVSSPSRPTASPHYRYSIVFVLRAHSPIPIDTQALTTPFTGTFTRPMMNITAGDLFLEISRAAYNVNISKEVRKGQKERLRTQRNGAPAEDGGRDQQGSISFAMLPS